MNNIKPNNRIKTSELLQLQSNKALELELELITYQREQGQYKKDSQIISKLRENHKDCTGCCNYQALRQQCIQHQVKVTEDNICIKFLRLFKS